MFLSLGDDKVYNNQYKSLVNIKVAICNHLATWVPVAWYGVLPQHQLGDVVYDAECPYYFRLSLIKQHQLICLWERGGLYWPIADNILSRLSISCVFSGWTVFIVSSTVRGDLQFMQIKFTKCTWSVCLFLIGKLSSLGQSRLLVWFGLCCLMTPGHSKDIQSVSRMTIQ